jgi:hypothetical protein
LILTFEAVAMVDAVLVAEPWTGDAPLLTTKEKSAITETMLRTAKRCRGGENIRFLPVWRTGRSRTARTLSQRYGVAFRGSIEHLPKAYLLLDRTPADTWLLTIFKLAAL